MEIVQVTVCAPSLSVSSQVLQVRSHKILPSFLFHFNIYIIQFWMSPKMEIYYHLWRILIVKIVNQILLMNIFRFLHH